LANSDFKDFLNSRNEAYSKELFPYLNDNSTIDESVLNNDNFFEDIGRMIGTVYGKSTVRANYISLKHLEAYHQWLLENYELVPKK